MKLIILCLLASFSIKESFGIILNDVDVPEVVTIENDGLEKIKLDCDYVVEGNPDEFLVQWKKNDILIYQWIYKTEPKAIHPYENEVDEYEVSKEPFHQYRGIYLLNPSIATTGEYKCIVRSYEGTNIDEKSMSKKLQVVHTANHTMNLYHQRIENETHVECSVNDVYPEPKLLLKTDDGDPIHIIANSISKDEDGFYNATTIAVVSDDDEDPDAYICTVMFPGLSVNLTKTAESAAKSFLRPGFCVFISIILFLIRLR